MSRDYHCLVRECTAKLAEDAGHVLALRLRAQSYRMLGDDSSALADYDQLLTLEPDDVDALFYRGMILEKQERFGEAIQVYNDVIRLQPQHHKALYNRAVCHNKMENIDQAIEDYSAALELDQPDKQVYKCAIPKGPRRQVIQQQQHQHPQPQRVPFPQPPQHQQQGQHSPRQQSSASSGDASLDAAPPGHAAHFGQAHPHPFPYHLLQHVHDTGLSSTASASDVSAAGWDRRVSAASPFSATPQSTTPDPPASVGDDDAGNAAPSTGTASIDTLGPHGWVHSGGGHGPGQDVGAAGPGGFSSGGAAAQHLRNGQGRGPLQHPHPHLSKVSAWAGHNGSAGGAFIEPAASARDSLVSWLPPGSAAATAVPGAAAERRPFSGPPVDARAPPQSLSPQPEEEEDAIDRLHRMYLASQQHDRQEGTASTQLQARVQSSLQWPQGQQRDRSHARDAWSQGADVASWTAPELQAHAIAGQEHAGAFANGHVRSSLSARNLLQQADSQPLPQQHAEQHELRPHHQRNWSAGTGHVQAHGVPALSRSQQQQWPQGPGQPLPPVSPLQHQQEQQHPPYMHTGGHGAAAAAYAAEGLRSPSPFERSLTCTDEGSIDGPGDRGSHHSMGRGRFPDYVQRPQPRQLPQQQQHGSLQAATQLDNGHGAHAYHDGYAHGGQAGAAGAGAFNDAAMSGSYAAIHAQQQHQQQLQPQSQSPQHQAPMPPQQYSEQRSQYAPPAGALRRSPHGTGSGGGASSAGGGHAGPNSADAGGGAVVGSLEPWGNGSHGGMAAALEMSRPSTSSSAASDAAELSSRHRVLEQVNARAFALRQQGKLQEAVREYSRALEVEPGHFKTLFNRGFTFDRLGELHAAVEDYTAALAVEPHSSYAYYNRGITRDRLQDFAGAVEDFSAAIALEPGNADFYHNRGFALRKQGKFEEAIRDYTAAIQLNPTHCRAYYNRAFCHDRLNHVQQAIDDYSKALEMEPNNATALHNRGSLHERNGRPALAIEDFGRAIAADPGCAQSYNARGVLLQSCGRLGEALADLDRAVELMQPPSATLFRNRAQARREMGDHHGAVQDLTRAISLDPLDLLSFSRRAHCFRRMGEYESAIRDYTRAISLSPNNAKLHTIRAYCYAMIGFYREAVEDYDAVLAMEPGNAHALYNRSIAVEKLGGAIDRVAANLQQAASGAGPGAGGAKGAGGAGGTPPLHGAALGPSPQQLAQQQQQQVQVQQRSGNGASRPASGHGYGYGAGGNITQQAQGQGLGVGMSVAVPQGGPAAKHTWPVTSLPTQQLGPGQYGGTSAPWPNGGSGGGGLHVAGPVRGRQRTPSPLRVR